MDAFVRSEPKLEPKSDRAVSTASATSPPDGIRKRASGSLADTYSYSPLSERGNIRLLRLMPHKDKEAPIRCQLFEYPLQEPGQGTHLYEALSYVWGSRGDERPIYIQSDNRNDNSAAGNSRPLPITANLHTALSHVRDRLLERVMWIDAVCIDQKNDDEKGQQVQCMAKIYANANRVIVWLGEAASDSDRAFGALYKAAAKEPIDESTQQPILALLKRPWFQRIWVLQEVAAARQILIKCGSSEIDGSVFCSGLDASDLPYHADPDLRGLILPITYLIRYAIFWPQCTASQPETNPPDIFSLNIRPLGELIDMYHTREATEQLDMIYALLGMSSDNPRTAGLFANYTTSWGEASRKLIQFSLSDQTSVSVWDERSVVAVWGKGRILGRVSSVEEDNNQGGMQNISISWNKLGNFDTEGKENSLFRLQASAKPIYSGDIVCLLQGASKPTIVRPCDSYLAIIVIAAPLAEIDNIWSERLQPITASPMDLILIWDWEVSQYGLQDRDYESLMASLGNPAQPRPASRGDLDTAVRFWHFGVFLNGIEKYPESSKNLRRAVEIYGAALGNVDTHPGRSIWIGADEEALRAMDDLVVGYEDAAIKPDSFNGQTPLLWAAEQSHEAVVKLLLDRGAAIETKDEGGRTPLSCAARQGREAIVKLLLERGASIETKDTGGQTPLSCAAEKGHEAIVKLLLDRGAAIETKDEGGRTPRSWAAENGHEAVVKLLRIRGG